MYEWDPPAAPGDHPASRYFVGTSRKVRIEQRKEPIEITIDGTQWADNAIMWQIVVNELHPDITPLTAAEALELAQALTEAAVELGRLDGSLGGFSEDHDAQ